jgi:hypothetical protein
MPVKTKSIPRPVIILTSGVDFGGLQGFASSRISLSLPSLRSANRLRSPAHCAR